MWCICSDVSIHGWLLLLQNSTFFVDPSLLFKTIYLLCFSMPGRRVEDFKRNNVFSQYDIYSHAQAHKPLPQGHEIYNFGRTFLGHHYYFLSLSDLCLGVEKKFFKGIMHFHYKIYMATPWQKNPCPGAKNLQFC